MIPITFLLCFSQRLLQGLSAEGQFARFKEYYGKVYESREDEELAFRVFCLNVKDLVASKCDSCEVRADYDKLQEAKAARQQRSIEACQEMLCYYRAPERDSPSLRGAPQSVELSRHGLMGAQREYVGGCGSCWSFGLGYVLENAVLRALGLGILPEKQDRFWRERIEKEGALTLSPQYFLSSIFGQQTYCNGGNFVNALQWMAGAGGSVETAAAFPYDYIGRKSQFDARIVPESSVPAEMIHSIIGLGENHFYKETQVRTAAAAQLFHYRAEPAGLWGIQRVKRHLLRGLAVAGSMYIGDKYWFKSFHGKTREEAILHAECPRFETDHQVVIEGFGKIDGVPVWKVRNSFQDWGFNGSFYVEIGRNSFCIEHYFYGLYPRRADMPWPDAVLAADEEEENADTYFAPDFLPPLDAGDGGQSLLDPETPGCYGKRPLQGFYDVVYFDKIIDQIEGCTEACPNGMGSGLFGSQRRYRLGMQCVTHCPSGFFRQSELDAQVELECIDACSGFRLEREPNSFECVEWCPDEMVIRGNRCVSSDISQLS